MSITAPARRFAWLTLLAMALVVRALTPDGWMPSQDRSGGVTLTWCNGMGGAMAMAADGLSKGKQPDRSGHASHPCAFAGIGGGNTAPTLPVVAAPAIVAAAPAPLAVIDRQPGRGLAAPPPPATGPPSLA